MSSFILVDKSKCTGCRHCEYICSFVHNNAFNVNRSRIQVVRKDCLDFDTLVCLNCKNPKCIKACPVGAITKDGDGNVLVNPNLCTGCGACVKACNRMFFDFVASVAINCDLCGSCIPECPEQALSIRTIKVT